MKVISTDLAPAAVGPYSQAVDAGSLVFLSGQLGIDPSTGKLVEGVQAQAHQAFKNIGAVLNEAGLDYSHVVKVLVLLDSIDDFATVNQVYAQYLKEPYPARSAFAVDALPLGGLVEIEVIASKEK